MCQTEVYIIRYVAKEHTIDIFFLTFVFLDILSLTDSRVLKVTYSKLGTWRLNKRISIHLA